jgi:hypothetical protein
MLHIIVKFVFLLFFPTLRCLILTLLLLFFFTFVFVWMERIVKESLSMLQISTHVDLKSLSLYTCTINYPYYLSALLSTIVFLGLLSMSGMLPFVAFDFPLVQCVIIFPYHHTYPHSVPEEYDCSCYSSLQSPLLCCQYLNRTGAWRACSGILMLLILVGRSPQ